MVLQICVPVLPDCFRNLFCQPPPGFIGRFEKIVNGIGLPVADIYVDIILYMSSVNTVRVLINPEFQVQQIPRDLCRSVGLKDR